MKTRLILVRHCEAAGNKDRFFQGHINGQVSSKGLRQLDALRERMRPVHLDAVYSSPLYRAVATARVMLCGRGLEMHLDERLMEINGGVWEGKRWADLPELYPEQARYWSQEPWNFSPEGGESMAEVQSRMSAAVLDIAARHPGQTVAIATHGCALRTLMCWAKGWSLERLNDVEWCDNTGVTVIDIDGGQPTIVMEGDCSHLTHELSTLAHQRWWKEKGSVVFDD